MTQTTEAYSDSRNRKILNASYTQSYMNYFQLSADGSGLSSYEFNESGGSSSVSLSTGLLTSISIDPTVEYHVNDLGTAEQIHTGSISAGKIRMEDAAGNSVIVSPNSSSGIVSYSIKTGADVTTIDGDWRYPPACRTQNAFNKSTC